MTPRPLYVVEAKHAEGKVVGTACAGESLSFAEEPLSSHLSWGRRGRCHAMAAMTPRGDWSDPKLRGQLSL
jgi:hypothetical protein